MDIGIKNAVGQAIINPLPQSWLGRVDMPPVLPSYANIYVLNNIQIRNLQAQIGYNKSFWDYTKIGIGNTIGRYQFSPALLETYGLLSNGSTEHYGTDCVNYTNCWRPVTIRNSNGYASYLYNDSNLTTFLNNSNSQEHLAYQYIYDLYTGLISNGAITKTDSADVIAGMISVSWDLGIGTTPNGNNSNGTGAYAWRYHNVGTGANAYNSGRYAITILSQ